MAKTTVLALVLLGVVCAQALEIRVTPTPAERKLLSPLGSPLLTLSNRDCSIDGIFPVPGDCTAYIICRKGREYRRKCPDNFFFDSEMYCTPDDTADCGAPLLKQALEKKLCPRSYGIFPDVDDCHKYVVCHEGRAKVRTCPEGTVYRSGTGCVDGDTCPTPDRSEAKKSEETEEHDYEDFQCKRSGRFANPNSCDSYIECSVKPDSVELELVQCPRDQHYNIETKQCDDKCNAQCDQELAGTDCAPHPDFLCPGDGTYFYLGNCSRYQVCKDGKATSRECPRGTHFSKETIRCEMPCNAKCDQSLASECGWTSSDEDSRDEHNIKETLLRFECKDDGFYPHPNKDCSQFVQCSNGEVYGMYCAKGLHFSSEHQRCLSPCKARCDLNIPCFIEERLCDKGKCFQCPTEDGDFSDLYDCSIYHECTAGSSTIKACHDGKLFDHRTSRCMRKEKALCVYQCEKLNSVNPHPQDMNSFIQCENGRSTVKKCPDGKVFKVQIGQCEDLHSERNSLLDVFYTNGNEWTR